MKILKEIRNSPFIKYAKRFYLGRLRYGAPYFYPRNYCSTIFTGGKIENKPQFIRIKHLSFKIFNKSYWVGIGTPIIVRYISLGWKDKYGTPRCEWQPFLTIYFFNFQFVCFFISPNKEELFDDVYWEMFLWWKCYSNRDIKKAEETWQWSNFNTGISTWNKEYLKMNNKTFIVEYLLDDFTKNKKIKVKKCLDKIHAELKFSEYIKRKNPNSRFKIINIEEENDILSNLFDIFGFKK
jgi:hypothetical protein